MLRGDALLSGALLNNVVFFNKSQGGEIGFKFIEWKHLVINPFAHLSKCSLQGVLLVLGSFICWRWMRMQAVSCVLVCQCILLQSC